MQAQSYEVQGDKTMKKRFSKTIPALLLASALVASVTACSTGSAGGGSAYPERAITIVAPSGAGGGWDKTARLVAKVLGDTKLVEKSITVENKPGGGGAVFMAEYATADVKNDYKLFVNSPPILINNNKKEGNSPYGYKDTTPLAQLTKDFGAIVVGADSPYNDLPSLLDAIKADPSSITVAGGSAPGSMDHLIAALPAFKYGIDPKQVKYVSYDGGGEAVAALLGGSADVIATDVSGVGEYLKAGKVKVLGISAPERLGGELGELKTFKEQGVDAEFLIWRGVFGPKEMSDDAKAFWSEKLKALSDNAAWKAELQANGWESDYKDADAFAAFLVEQDKLVQELLAALGMSK